MTLKLPNHVVLSIPVILAAAILAGCTQSGASGPATISTTAFIRPSTPWPSVKSGLSTGNTNIPDTPSTTTTLPTVRPADALPGQLPVIHASAIPKPGTSLAVAALLGTVNSKPLFVRDVLQPIQTALENAAAISKTRLFFQQQAEQSIARELRVKIDDILFLAKAKRYLSKDDMKEVAAVVEQKKAKIVAQYMGSEQLADRALRLQGSSLDEKLKTLRNQTIIQMYLSRTVYPKLVVTRRQLWHYYQAHRAQYTQHAKVDLYTITYKVSNQWPRDPNDPTHTQPLAHPTAAQIAAAARKALAYCDKLETEIRHGANFALLAENNSSDPAADNGGHWPDTRRGELSNPLIEKIAFSLKPHTMAPPVLIKNKANPRADAVVIIRVGAVTPHHIIAFGQAQAGILKKLRNRLYQHFMANYQRRMYDTASVAAMSQMVRTATRVATALYYTH
ncbi:MAG: peptidylprolyl isomerase [Phycisphaerae bacterium]